MPLIGHSREEKKRFSKHLAKIVKFYHSVILYTGKKSRFFKVFKRTWKRCITTVSKENFEKKSDDDDGGLQQQSPQRLIDRYEHMNSRNDHGEFHPQSPQ